MYKLTQILFHITVAMSICSIATRPATACELPTTLAHIATAIDDARTISLDDGSRLRLTSILPPTAFDSPAAPKTWPDEIAARKELSKLALNRNLVLSLERTARDRYGRLVGHGILDTPPEQTIGPIETRWLQALMVRTGHARVTLTPETSPSCARALLTLEAEAERAKRGLWRRTLYRPKRAEDIAQLGRYRSTFHIVEGVVARVAVLRSAVYLNFGANWKRDFTAKIDMRTLKRARITARQLKQFRKQPVRIRGWLEQRNGPMITVWRLEQIELLQLQEDGGTLNRHHPPNLLSDFPQEADNPDKKEPRPQ